MAWTAVAAGGQPGASGPAGNVEQRLVALKGPIMVADYRGDVPALVRLGAEAATLAGDPEWGHLARYWSGFASWRAAMNAANGSTPESEVEAHLERATAELEAAIAARVDFADGYAAAAGAHGWLARFFRDDPQRRMRHTVLYFTRLRRALALAPDNPRVLWIDASVDQFLPVEAGGSVERSILTYRRMLERSAAPQPASPLPDWGRPEALMSLAFAHSSGPQTDLVAAREHALAALRLEPEWSYVRDVLLPQIEAARAAVTTPEAGAN